MGYVDVFYWKLAILCCIAGLFFLFATTEGLIQGKFRLPAWVFSIFTLTIGVFFFDIFIDSLGEFSVGRHDSIDQLMDTWGVVTRFFGTMM